MNPLFKEEQKFTQWWLWIILIGIGALTISGIYQQLILGDNFGSNSTSDLGLIMFSLLTFTIIALFLLLSLRTEIDSTGIRMNFFPFFKRNVNWNEIKTVEVVNYGFVGGWGIRLGTSYGTVYNIKGNKGLAIVLQSGKKFLIGTQKENEMKEVIEEIKRISL